MTAPLDLLPIQEAVWDGSLPLSIRLSPADCRTYDKSDPYLIHFPRLSYLPFLLPRLQAFFASSCIERPESLASAWFSFEGVPLKWHYPAGLLYDLFAGAVPAHPPTTQAQNPQSLRRHSPQQGSGGPESASSSPLPWRLLLHFSTFPDDQLVRLDDEGRVLHDAFVNSVKEADFLRNGSAKAIMTLSKQDSTGLWEAVEKHDLPTFASIHNKLLPSSAELRHIPLRIYLPASLPPAAAQSTPPISPPPPLPSSSGLPGSPALAAALSPSPSPAPLPSHLKVVQVLVPPLQPQSRSPQTLGTALHAALPTLFPSRRTPILARPVLHGAVLPMAAVLEEVMRTAAYLDGWLHLGVEMVG